MQASVLAVVAKPRRGCGAAAEACHDCKSKESHSSADHCCVEPGTTHIVGGLILPHAVRVPSEGDRMLEPETWSRRLISATTALMMEVCV